MAEEIDSPEFMFFEADRLIESNQIVEATALLNRLVGLHPHFGRAFNHLGYIYETRFRDQVKAEEYYKEGMRLSPDYPALYLNYAILLANQQRFEELEIILDVAMQCPGINLPKVLHERGMMYETQGRYDEAQEVYLDAFQKAFLDADIELIEASMDRLQRKIDFFKKQGVRSKGKKSAEIEGESN
jgi:tetratricopeptide (TPR) repeat protein